MLSPALGAKKEFTPWRPALLALILICSAGQILALDPTSHISQYGHTVWRVQDGYFGTGPEVIAQTKDGYIWVGTGAGLFKFDGVRFVRWTSASGEELPPVDIYALLSARDGSLWIGTESGLVHLVNNRLIFYQKNEGWAVTNILEDRDGKIWFRRLRADDRTHTLCELLDAGVRCYGSEDGVDAFAGTAIAQDSLGDLWVGGTTTLVRWRPGAAKVYRPRALQSNEGNGGIRGLVPETDGSVWVGMALAAPGAGLQRVVNGTLKPFRAPGLNGEAIDVEALRSDRESSLWVGTTQGLYRICGTDVDHYAGADGLSSDWVRDIFQDREGNIWVATSRGIDMLRDLRVKSISKREGLSVAEVESIATSRDGKVWIGTGRLQLLGPRGVSLFAPAKNLPGNLVASLLTDHAGHLWAGMINKLFVYESGSFHEVRRPDGSATGMVMGIAEDSDHIVWVESAGPPAMLLKIQDQKVRQQFPAPAMPLARKIVADPQGGIWLGLMTGDLARYRDGQISVFTFGDHPDSRVMAITVASDGSILGATGFGLVGWKNGKQQTLTVQNGLPCNNVDALISDDAGNLWLDTKCGLVEIAKQQMQLWWQHPENKLSLRVFDILDGVEPGWAPFNSSAKTPDGRLWFTNGSVVQVIDPAHIPENTLPPPVDISALVADRKAYPLDSAVRLPPRTRDLEIDYTALSFTAPQKAHFRYMLEGHDARWQNPGTRRQAFYNNLPPRKYRFRVKASNSDGVWNETGASLEFSILPAYYQTAWFRMLCAAAILLLLWFIYQLRLRQLQHQFNIGLEAQVNERTRIARDLHDTLLQTLHGLMFQFQAVRNMLPRRPDEAMKSLDDAINETERALEESRDAIQGLRSRAIARGNLADLLVATMQELTAIADRTPPIFDLVEEGERRALSAAIGNEICRIAVEISRNAFRHSEANRIEAEIRYDNQTLRLRIRDDGRGIDPKVLKEGARPGHWGLRGIRERAERIGARLEFWSESGAGTEVQLTVPATLAYHSSRNGVASGFLRKIRNHAQHS